MFGLAFLRRFNMLFKKKNNKMIFLLKGVAKTNEL